jgi:hypothetical protein
LHYKGRKAMASKKQSVAGKALALFTSVRQGLKRRGGIGKQLESLREPAVIAAIVSLTMVPVAVALQPVDHTVSITMDLSKSMAQLLVDGKYDWVDGDIAKHFSVEPEKGRVIRDIHLLHYNKLMLTDAILADMERQGLRPLTFLELFWIGIQYPSLQRDFHVVALGTVRQVSLDLPCVVHLYRSRCGRSLNLHWIYDYWNEDCRFGAVRK